MADIDGGATFLRMVAYVLDRCERLESQQAVSGAWGTSAIDDMARLVKERDELRAEYDQHVMASNELDLQRLGEMARIAKERDELRAKLAEPSGDSGMLPRWWNVGDEIVRAEDGRRAKIIKVSHRIETEVDGKPGCAGEQWVAEKHGGWKLAEPAEPSGDSGQLPEISPFPPEQLPAFAEATAEPEPYQWKVGDIIACGNLRLAIERIDRTMPLPWIILADGSRQSQTYWEAVGFKLHRKARDITLTISDSVGADGKGQP